MIDMNYQVNVERKADRSSTNLPENEGLVKEEDQ